MPEYYYQSQREIEHGTLTAEQRFTINQSWAEERVKELRDYSDSYVLDKLMEYDESDLEKLIDYVDTLSSFLIGKKRIRRLAQEAKQKRERIADWTHDAERYLKLVRELKIKIEDNENSASIAKNVIDSQVELTNLRGKAHQIIENQWNKLCCARKDANYQIENARRNEEYVKLYAGWAGNIELIQDAINQIELACQAKDRIEGHYNTAFQAKKRFRENVIDTFLSLCIDSPANAKETVVSLYEKDAQLMEDFVDVCADCPQLFEGEDAIELFKNDSELLKSTLQAYKENSKLYKELFKSLDSIKTVEKYNCSIEDLYNAIPQDVRLQLVRMIPWETIPSSTPLINDDDILRYYIKRASKSFWKADILVFVVKRILKLLLFIPVLPIPNVTTVYLLVNWSELLSLLSYKHYGDNALSKDKIVALSLSLVAILLQVLNRESVLSCLKTVYSGGVLAKDFIAQLPADLKQIIVKTFFANAKEQTKEKVEQILSYNIITWNNILGELTDIENLSMGKTMDMLYTFRVGSTFVDYSHHSTGLHLHSLSEYWKNYGPLPNNPEQMEKLFDLFRDSLRYSERVGQVMKKYYPSINAAKSYDSFLRVCLDLYNEVSFLELAYKPQSYNVNMLYTLSPKDNMKLILNNVMWAQGASTIDDVKSMSYTNLAEDLANKIGRQSPYLIS